METGLLVVFAARESSPEIPRSADGSNNASILMNLLGAQSPLPRHSYYARLKRWTREFLHLDEDVTLTIQELRCAEPGCPDLETVIGISQAPGQWQRLRIARPAADVTREDLRTAASHLLTGNP